MHLVMQNELPAVLLSAMIALSARFSTDATFVNIDPKERGDAFATEGQRRLDLRDVSVTTIQACIMLGAFSMTRGQPEAESVYHAAACRMAQLLDLPNRSVQDELEKEINLRVCWSLCMIDVWSSNGVSLPRQMSMSSDVPLPVDEAQFLMMDHRAADISGKSVKFIREPSLSLLAQMIKLNRIYLEITDVNKRAVSDALESKVVDSMVAGAAQRLEAWRAALPDGMQDTPANLDAYASRGLGRLFVAVWVGFYHYGQLIYYQYLHEAALCTAHTIYATCCKDNAVKLLDLIDAANAIPGCEPTHTMVGHVVVIASTVLIHTLLFDPEETNIALARSRLERNFETLIQLRKFWPTLDIVFSRLRAFHTACHTLRESSFRMDQWMLKFLSEFARPVDDKEIEEVPSPALLMV